MNMVREFDNKKHRSLFIEKYFSELKILGIKYVVIRGYREIFLDDNKDIDLLISPSDHHRTVTLFKELHKEFQGVFISSYVSNKNVYLKGLFVDQSDTGVVDGIFIHITAFVTIKTNYENRNKKFQGFRLWVDSFEIIEASSSGMPVFVPEPRIQVLFMLSKFLHKPDIKYLDSIQEIIVKHSLNGWVKDIDKEDCLSFLFLEKDSSQVFCDAFQLIKSIVESVRPKESKSRVNSYAVLIGRNVKQMFAYKGKLIFFSGPDGSGKTSSNEALSRVLIDKLKVPVINSKHLYPISNATSHNSQKIQAKLRRIAFDDISSRERDRGNGVLWKLRRLVGLLYILIQILPGYLYGRYKNYIGYTVIIDTSFFDAFVKGHRPEFPILQRLVVPFIPCGDHWFLMTASPEEIAKRKQELTEDEVENYYFKLGIIAGISKCKPQKIQTNSGVGEALMTMVKLLGSE